MEIFLFVVGSVIFLGLGILIVYWNIDDFSPEDCFYRSIFSIYAMAITLFLYSEFGRLVFGEIAQSWIVSVLSILFFLFILLYVLFYCVAYEWEYKLLALLPSLALQIFQIIKMNVIIPLFKDLGFVAVLVSTVVATVSIIYSIYYHNKSRRIEMLHTRYIRSHSDLPFELYQKNLDFSGNVSDNISYLVIKIYNYAQEGRLSPSRLHEILSRHDDVVPSSIKNRIVERFLESPYLNKADSMNLLEFATLLFPEFYGNYEKTYRSEKYDLRVFDEFYSLMHRNMNKEREQFERLNDKLEKIIQAIDTNTSTTEYASQDVEESNLKNGETNIQSILKEIHHLTKTPLQTIKVAIDNLSNAPDVQLSDVQKQKTTTILNNVLTVKLIIEAYKKLVFFSDVATNEDIKPYLETAISSLGERKNIKGKFVNFPNEKICVHGNNVIAILLLPLIHNAIEASPENEEILVSCTDTEDKYIICIENRCINVPRQKDLNTDGFTTRSDAKGGVGLMSVRRISASIGIKFAITAYNKTNKVVAKLTIPKK